MLILNEYCYEFIESILKERHDCVEYPIKWVRGGFCDYETYNAYMQNFAGSLDHNSLMKKYFGRLLKEREKINNISNLQVDQLNDLLISKLPNFERTDVVLNFFIGYGTCSAFPYVSRDVCSINIALEKLVENDSIYDTIIDLIIHELIHVLRIVNGKYKANTYGELIIEEGISCYVHKIVLELAKCNFQRIFPLDLTSYGKEEMRQYFKNIENNLDSSSLNEVYFGKEINELAAEHKIQPNLIRNWKREFMENASKAFDSKADEKAMEKIHELEEENDELAKKVGRQSIQLDWLKKKSEELVGPDYESKFSKKPKGF